jgi:hypothetical protein
LIKLDHSWGGRGVRLAHNHCELLEAALELSFSSGWPKPLKQLAARAVQHLPDRWRTPLPRDVSIQDYVLGRPANRAVVCWQGRILAGISVEAVETAPEFGPTTLARILDRGDLAEVTEKIVRNQNLSGFLGFDFMLDQADRAWFLEMNPRATPTCHLRFNAPSLPASLFSAVTGERPGNDVREVPQCMIALFPNRVLQKFRHAYFDDTPAEEPEFRDACKRSRFLRKILGRKKDATRPRQLLTSE